MFYNRRTEITNYLTNRLKEIDGEASPYDISYQFRQNIFNNAYRDLVLLDEVNDFPSLYLTPDAETRNFESKNLTVATLPVTIRAYVYGEDNSQEISDQLIEDIEHIIYSIGDNPEMGILDITINNIQTDEGLLSPYGIITIEISTVYRLED